MGFFQNPKILLVEPDELDVRLSRLQLFATRPIVIPLSTQSKLEGTYPTMRRFELPLVCMSIRTHEIPTASHDPSGKYVSVIKIRKINVRVPSALFEHHIRGYHVPIEPEHRLFQPMPLDDAHRLWDTTRTAPAVLGDRGHFLKRGGCGDGVVNVPPLVRDIRVHVVRRAEYEAHVGDRESEKRSGGRV